MENIEKKINKPKPAWADKAYRVLASKYGKHPKFGGSEEVLKDINIEMQNGEYAKILKRLKKYKEELVEEERLRAELATKEIRPAINGTNKKAMVTSPDYFTFDKDIKEKADAVFEGLSAMNSKIENDLKMSKPGMGNHHSGEGAPDHEEMMEGAAATPEAMIYKDNNTRTKQVYNGFGLSDEILEKINKVENGLKTVNIGKEGGIRMIRKNKDIPEANPVEEKGDEANEISLEALRATVEDAKKVARSNARVIDFSPNRPIPFQEKPFTMTEIDSFENEVMDRHIQKREEEADRRLGELIEEGKRAREISINEKKAPISTAPAPEAITTKNMEEPSIIRVPLSRPVEKPKPDNGKALKDINPALREERKAFTSDIGIVKAEGVPVSKDIGAASPLKKDSAPLKEKSPDPTITTSRVGESMTENTKTADPLSAKEGLGAIGVGSKEKSPEEEIPFIDKVSETRHEDTKDEEIFTMFKDLAEKELSMDSLRKKISKGMEIAKRFNVKKVVVTEAENEYRKVRKEYEAIKERLKGAFKGEESVLEKEIRTRKHKLGEMESRFSQEKAKEYLSHSKKILEYQKEMLSGRKAELMGKMESLARNKKLQAVLGLVLIGVSVDLPEIAGLLFTSGIPENIAPAIQTIGGVAGGYLAGGLSRAKKAIGSNDDFDMDKEIRMPPSPDNHAPRGKTVSFKPREPYSRDNFFRNRTGIEES